MKQYFIIETSVFPRGKLLENPLFSVEKTVLLEKYKFLKSKTRFSSIKEYFTSEIVFYSRNLTWQTVFLEKNFYKISVFSSGKDRFVRKIQVSTSKTRFSSIKEYFTSEIVFYSSNISFPREKLLENPFFPVENTVCRKNTILKSKTRFSSLKEYITSEIVFYSGNLSFPRENSQKIRFFQWKRPFCQKNTSFNIENEVFSYKRVLYI